MAFEFKLPDLGEGVHEGEIVKWLVAEGDVVRSEQPLVEVMTDKVTAELPSPVAGKVTKLGGKAGEVLPVGAVLISIETDAPVLQPSVSSPFPNGVAGGLEAPEASEPAVPREGASLAVPAVRRLAKELGVDLSTLSGSGPGGRITEADVRAAVVGATSGAASPARSVRRIPLRGMRRIIAEHLMSAQRNTAPYTYVEEVDFTELVRLRERLTSLKERTGVHLTYLPFILAAVSMALKEHPYLNATVDASGDLLLHSEQHIGVAVHTDDGLVVPVLRNVDQKHLLDLAREIERLSAAARSGTLSREEVTGSTFSVTSLGQLGGLHGTPMLNTPEVAVLGVHRIQERPAVRDGAIVPRHLGNLSLTLDHRYIDGYIGAQFARTLVMYLEDPAVMLFWLAELRDHIGEDPSLEPVVE